MTVAARQIDWEAWSQSRFLAWAETQPEGCRYEFDGFRPVAMAPATVGHNRIGRNIRDAIRPRLPAGRAMRHLWTAGCDRNSRRRPARAGRIHRVFQAAPERGRRPAPIVVFEVVSPGRGNRRRDEEKVDEYQLVPSILRYVVVESESSHSVRSGANLVSRRGTGTLPTRPDQFACRNLASTSRLTRFIPGSTSIEAGGLCGLIGLRFVSTHARAAVQYTERHVQSDAGERESPCVIGVTSSGHEPSAPRCNTSTRTDAV